MQLATLRALARYWSTEYDWRKCEARLNVLPQFTTVIDGVKIHYNEAGEGERAVAHLHAAAPATALRLLADAAPRLTGGEQTPEVGRVQLRRELKRLGGGAVLVTR